MHRLRCALLLTLVPLLTATAARAERFRYKLRPEQTLRNRISVAAASLSTRGEAQPVKMQFRSQVLQTQRVRASGNGQVTVQVSELTQSGQMTVMGRTQSLRERRPETYVVRMTDRGKFLSRSSAGEGTSMPGLEAMDALFGLAFPDQDLKPGDTWQETVQVRSDLGPRTVRLTGKYVGRETFRSRQCARFQLSLTMPFALGPKGDADTAGLAPEGQVTATVTCLFDPEAGHEVYSSGTATVLARLDLSSLGPDAGEMANVFKLNFVQSLQEGGARK